MPTPSSRLFNPCDACPHPVQGFKSVELLLCMPTPSSRLLNPISACLNQVQGSPTQFKAGLTALKWVRVTEVWFDSFELGLTALNWVGEP
jgi:hypothetical protein